MSKKVFIAEQETLLEVQEQVEKLVRNLVLDDAPIYGMVIHEASDLNPSTRVEYLGANKDFTPMSMNMSTHAMNYGSWADWDWLKANVPVMCNWDGGIDYFLDPDDYTKKADGTNSDAANIDYAGDAMAIVKKIYKKEYKVGNDRYVYFCERKVDDDFHAVGFNVLGKERDYMLIPMFYGSIDSNGKMRSIAGQLLNSLWFSCRQCNRKSNRDCRAVYSNSGSIQQSSFLWRCINEYIGRHLYSAEQEHRLSDCFWIRHVFYLR